MSLDTLRSDVQLTAPDAHIIAQSMVDSAKRINKAAPVAADLAEAILSIAPESHIKGASALKLTIEDPAWALLDSGFFSPTGSTATRAPKSSKTKPKVSNDLGKLDPIDVNYPDGSRFWWRLSTVSPKAGGTIDLTFIDRIAALLQDAQGPIKASRDSMTRAEFLRMVTQRIKQYGGIQFHSEQLDVRQPIDPVTLQAPVSSNKVKKKGGGAKTGGIGANQSGLTVKEKPITASQVQVANLIIGVAHQLRANEAATVAALYAAMGESSLGDYPTTYVDNGHGFTGVFQGHISIFNPHDTTGQATCFFKGGKGFQGGGAIAMSQNITNPAEIAIKVEVPSKWPQDAYAPEWTGGAAEGLDEARAILQAGGGAAIAGDFGPGTTVETAVPYFFTIGTTSDQHESLWDGSIREAQEVNWEYFTDGDRVYYDSEMTLIKQKVAAVISRDDPAVVDWSYDWERRNIATQMTLQLICDPFALRAGEVVQLEKFGPASDGSTAKLPGRWLIADILRNPGDLSSQFTLKQPEAPKNEPAPQTVTVSIGGGTGGTGGVGGALSGSTPGTAEAVLAAAEVLSSKGLPYIWGGGHSPGALDDPNPRGFDCSGAVCWCLHKAGLFPSSAAWTSGVLASSWGQPGRGQAMTVWANSVHCFIEFNIPGTPHQQMNTVNPGDRGPRLEPWSYSNADAGDGAANGGAFVPRH